MGGCIEFGFSPNFQFGECNYCGVEGPVNRKYFYYGIKCECHSPEHFQIVWYCDKCEPVDPGVGPIKLTKEQRHNI